MVSTWILLMATTAHGVVRVSDDLRIQKAQEVINELGFYDAMEVEKRARLHLLDQPIPDIPGKKQGSGQCNTVPCYPITKPFSYPVPNPLKVQGTLLNKMNMPNIRLKFSGRNEQHTAETEAGLNAYVIRIVKDGAYYEDYSFNALRTADGGLPAVQFARIRNLQPGNYEIHLASYYYINGQGSYTDFTSFESFTVTAFEKVVAELADPQLKSCILANGHSQSDLLKDLEKLDCANSGLTDNSVTELKNNLISLRYLNLSNNNQLTKWGGLGSMTHLSWLDLSDNPQMNVAGARGAGDIDSIILSGLNLSSVQGASWNASYIDLSNNNITGAYSELFRPNRSEAIQALDLSGNPVVTATDPAGFKTAVTGQFIDAIDLSQTDIQDVNDLVDTNGLKHVNLNGASQLSTTQDITDFGGFCGFSMSNTPVKNFNGTMKPIQFLNLSNNPDMYKVQALNQSLAEPQNFWPLHVDLSGSNAMKCGNYYNFIDFTTPPDAFPLLTSMGVSGLDPATLPTCPMINWPGVFNQAEDCMMHKVETASGYEDITTQTRYITWTLNHAAVDDIYQRWGVTHHQVLALNSNDEVIDSRNVLLNAEFQAARFDSLEAVQYTVAACNPNSCGYTRTVSSFDRGLTRPTLDDGAVIFDTSDPNNLRFKFNVKYEANAFNQVPGGRPDSFRIYSTFPQSDGDFLVVDFTNIGTQHRLNGWFTAFRDREDVVGTAFQVVACNALLGCSKAASVSVNDPVIDASLPRPIWSGVSYDASELNMTLNWHFGGNDSSAVDYIEVSEIKPAQQEGEVISANPNTDQLAPLLFTSHLVEGPLVLNRIGKGDYDYKIRTCQRDDDAGDRCSAWSLPHSTVTVSRSEVNAVTMKQPSNIGWTWTVDEFGNPVVDELFWELQGGSVEPDYFLLSTPNNIHSGYCLLKKRVVNDAGNNYEIQYEAVTGVRINWSDFKDPSGDITFNTQWSSSTYCEHIKPSADSSFHKKFYLQTCKNGVGCTEPVGIDFREPSPNSNPPQSNSSRNSVSGGPGDFSPGHWWHRDLAGTGWNFFWANGLRFTEQHGRYGEAYDLVGYWLSYKKLGENWTPAWFEARLKFMQNTSGGNQLFQGDIYYHERITDPVSGETQINSIDTGNIMLRFDPNSSSQATMALNLDYALGHFTEVDISKNIHPYTVCDIAAGCNGIETGSLMLEIEDFSVFNINQTNNTPNDADHYMGLWQKNITDMSSPLSSAEVSVLTWIDGGVETEFFLYFDGDGQPVWLQSAYVCFTDNPLCENAPAGYFDDFDQNDDANDYNLITIPNGFNPLTQRPAEGWVGDALTGVGYAGRSFEQSDGDTAFREAKFWFDVERAGVLEYRNIATFGAHGTGQSSMQTYEKRANLHGIFYQINDADISLQTCDPNVQGQCDIRFSWYTDDNFDSIHPQYSFNGGGFQPLENLPGCSSNVPGGYVVTGEYQCTIEQPGTYVFQLHKDKYLSPTQTVAIAESKPLIIEDCVSGLCSTGNDPQYATAPNPAQHTLASNDASSLVGFTSGALNIDMSGASTYSIPVFTPKGTGGLSPQLSLNYNSNGGNDVAGQGWNISGTSAISRCLRNVEQDGITLEQYQPISLTNADAFCLDGQKLLQVPNGNTHGTVGAEYRTEMESFSKVVVAAADASGPTQFSVYLKNGEIRTYGASGVYDAQVMSADGTAVMTWLMNEIADRNGNSMRFIWDNSLVGESYLEQVEYTLRSNMLTPQNVIEFNYETRSDQAAHYSQEAVNKRHKRLSNIQTKRRITPASSLQTIRKLDLTYAYSPLSGQSQLNSVTECADAGNTNCLQPVVFTWSSDGSEDWFKPYNTATGNILRFKDMMGSPKPIDINGDGVSEMVFAFYFEDNGNNPEVRFALAGNSRTIDLEGNGNLFPPDTPEFNGGAFCADTNNGSFYNRTCNTEIQPAEPEDYTINNNDFYVFDFNGDGFDDLLTPVKNNMTWRVSFSNGSKICQSATSGIGCLNQMDTQIGWFPNANSQNFADFTGDGLPDLLAFDVSGEVQDQGGRGLYTSIYDSAQLHISDYVAGSDRVEFTQSVPVTLDTSGFPINTYQMYCENLDPNSGPPFDNPYISCPEFENGGVFIPRIASISPLPADVNGDGLNDVLVAFQYLHDTQRCLDGTNRSIINEDNYCWVKFWSVHSFEPGQGAKGNLTGHLKFISNIGYSTSPGYVIQTSTDQGATIQDFDFGSLINFGFDQDIQMMDMNGDFQADVVTTEGFYLNQHGLFETFVPFDLIDASYAAAIQTNPGYNEEKRDDDFKYLTQYVDVDYDGDLDVLYPSADNNSNNGRVNYRYKTLEYTATSGYHMSAAKTPPSSILARKSNSKAEATVHMFADLNGDSFVDHFYLKRGDSNSTAQEKHTFIGNDSWKAKDKIVSIRKTAPNGLFDETIISYESATLPTVYARGTNGYGANWGNGSFVFDVKSPMYLVRQVEQKSPTEGLANNYSKVLYHYKGLRVQGGGRGSLGFAEISSIDYQNQISTQTAYRQDYPFTGNPEWTMKNYHSALNNAAQTTFSCAVGEDDCSYSVCSSGDSCMDPMIDGQNFAPMTSSLNTYNEVSPASTAGSSFVYLFKSVEEQFEFGATEAHAFVVTKMNYENTTDPAHFYGNVSRTISKTCTAYNVASCDALTYVEVDNTYAEAEQDPDNWILGRLTTSVTTNGRRNLITGTGWLTDATQTGFSYDPVTGQVLEEVIHEDKADQSLYLKTRHYYDSYGNETHKLACSRAVVNAQNCHKDYRPAKIMPSQLDVFRYSEMSYDNQWHMYPDRTYGLYHDDGQQAVIKVQTGQVNSRDVFGNALRSSDLLNNTTVESVFGLFGEEQANKSNTGAYSESHNYWCVSNSSLHCPSSAAIVSVTHSPSAPDKREYKDAQGRVVRAQTQSMGDASNPGAWTTIDTWYDDVGRSVKTSMPYFRKNSDGSRIGSMYSAVNLYDVFGRLELTSTPAHTGGSAITTITRDGLKTTTINAKNQKRVEYSDVSGKVVKIEQFLDDHNTVYSTIEYIYGASGNLLQMTANGATTTITYDDLGRKRTMSDPDKGNWSYTYNAVGEQLTQQDGLGQEVINTYDFKGRLVQKTAINVIGEQPLENHWVYGAAGRYGKLTSEYSVIQDQADAVNGRERIDKVYQHDFFGRVNEVTTYIADGEQGNDTSVYTQKTTFDEYGRVFQNIDPTGFGTMALYNSYGYQDRILEAAECMNQSSSTCVNYQGRKYRSYYQALAMDPFGNVIKEAHHDGTLTTVKNYHKQNGFMQNTCFAEGSTPDCASNGPMNFSVQFGFDVLGNLVSKTDAENAETFEYDALNRLREESRQINGGPAILKSHDYHANGNLWHKDGTLLEYDQINGAGPHAVTGFGGISYHYDAVGNMTSSINPNGEGNKAIQYTALNKAYLIHNSDNNKSAYFQYDNGHSRYVRKDLTDGVVDTTTHYIGNVEMIRGGEVGRAERYKRYIGNLIIDLPARLAFQNSWDYSYQFKDHLGSAQVTVTVNREGVLAGNVQRPSFDAWGQRRYSGSDDLSNPDFDVFIATTTRGFTGHEHLDDVGIIHMNGRIYDPTLGRFLQADPHIQDPFDTQSLNRYSYVGNNPLSLNDPTGYWSMDVFLKNWGRPLASIAVSFIPVGGQYLAIMLKGAVSGAITGGTKGALIGAFTAAAFHGIGESFDKVKAKNVKAADFKEFANTGLSAGQFAGKVAMHGMVGGASSVLQGGKFGHGFASAGATEALSPGIDNIETGGAPMRIAVAAIVGGTISEATGGKFVNGAVTGAFSRAFNAELHREEKRRLSISRAERKGMSVKEREIFDKAIKKLKFELKVAEDDFLNYSDEWNNRPLGVALISAHKHIFYWKKVDATMSFVSPETAESGIVYNKSETDFLPYQHGGQWEMFGTNRTYLSSGQYDYFGVVVIAPTINSRNPLSSFSNHLQNLANSANAPSFLILRGKVYGYRPESN